MDTIVDTIREARKGLPLGNAVRAAAMLLPEMGTANAQRVANVVAQRLAETPEATPSASLVANIAVATDNSYKDQLVGHLSVSPATEDSTTRTHRGLALLRIAAAAGSFPDLRIPPALGKLWSALAEQPDWNFAKQWLSAKDDLRIYAKQPAGISAEFFSAMLASIGGSDATPDALSDVEELLAGNHEAMNSPGVLHAAVMCCTQGRHELLRTLSLKLVKKLSRPSADDAPGLIKALSGAYGSDEEGDRDAILLAASILNDWLPIYVDLDLDDPDGLGTSPLADAAGVVAKLARVATPVEAEVVQAFLHSVVEQQKHEEADSIVLAIAERISDGSSKNDPVAREFLFFLEQEALELPAAASAVEKFVKDTVTATHTSSSPEARLALEVLGKFAQNAPLEAKLTGLATAWVVSLPTPQLPSPGQWEHISSAIQIAIETGNLQQKALGIFEQRLRVYAASAPIAQHALKMLVSTSWPTDARPQVATDIDAAWDMIPDDLRSEAVSGLASWDIPIVPALAGKLTAHMASSRDCREHIPQLWERIRPEDRTALVIAAARSDQALANIADPDVGEIVTWLRVGAAEGIATRVISLVSNNAAASDAARVILDTMHGGTEMAWDDELARVLTRELVRVEYVQAMYLHLVPWLAEGAEQAKHAADVIDELVQKQAPKDPDSVAGPVANAILAADDDTARRLRAAAKAGHFETRQVRAAWKERKKGKGLIASLLP